MIRRPDARACGSIENPVRTGNARACGSTEPAGRWVEGDLGQERLVVGLAPAQPEEADLASIEIEFAADEPVDPLAMDRVPDAENRHRALVARPADEHQTTGGRRRTMKARVASSEERARLWPEVVQAYSGYGQYQTRTSREIPLVILEPTSA